MNLDELKRTYTIGSRSPARRMDLIGELASEACDLDPSDLEHFLVEVLGKDLDSIVRHEAAFVLGQLKKFGRIEGKISAQALCRAACDDESLVVCHEAAEALHSFEEEVVKFTLEQLLHHENRDIRATAVISLERLKFSSVGDTKRMVGPHDLAPRKSDRPK